MTSEAPGASYSIRTTSLIRLHARVFTENRFQMGQNPGFSISPVFNKNHQQECQLTAYSL
jgi:hypothetical protein